MTESLEEEYGRLYPIRCLDDSDVTLDDRRSPEERILWQQQQELLWMQHEGFWWGGHWVREEDECDS